MHTPSKGRTFIHLVLKYTYKTGSQTQIPCSGLNVHSKLYSYFLIDGLVFQKKLCNLEEGHWQYVYIKYHLFICH